MDVVILVLYFRGEKKYTKISSEDFLFFEEGVYPPFFNFSFVKKFFVEGIFLLGRVWSVLPPKKIA